MAAQNGHLALAEFLLKRGADPSIEDDLCHATPQDHAGQVGQPEVRDYRNWLET